MRMQILTSEEMAAADRRSVDAGVAVSSLMESAGAAVARFCMAHYASDGRVVVLCGKGNNGGDGFVAARKLREAGRDVHAVLLGLKADVKGDAATAMQQAGDMAEVADESSLCDVLHDVLKGAVLAIDAVVGTGFRPPLRGLAEVARQLLAKSDVPVVAVDLPSGWDADSTARRSDTAFRADAVVTFVAPKLAHVFGALTAPNVFGPVVVAEIGTPADAIQSASALHWAGMAKSVAEQPRDVNGNKGKFGHVLLVGGAVGKAGAPSMASLASMRAGAGLTTCAVVKEILPTVAAVAPELMLTELESSGAGVSLAMLENEKLKELLKGISVVAIGPGLGQAGTTAEFVREFVKQVELPMVIDADALNALAGRGALLKEATQAAKAKGKPRTIVLTPHPGEMARLVGLTVKEVEADRVGLARSFATENGVTLVLKGWRTLIAHPDGRVGVNTTGNPSMAKGGSGDILTGIVAAMLAQYGDSVAEAVEAAVFLHGFAGDYACLAQDEHTVLATDTVAHLKDAFKARVRDDDGFVWIAGGATARGVAR
jgi:hydroxyethylthiazole kinase-like uncharacterized protein yjeF